MRRLQNRYYVFDMDQAYRCSAFGNPLGAIAPDLQNRGVSLCALGKEFDARGSGL